MKMKGICERTGISKRNIHFYIKEGLLTPATNPEKGYYDFSEEDCQKILFIKQMRNAGMSIQTILSILTYPVTADFYLNQHIRKLKKEQRHLEQTLISLQYIQDDLPFYPDFTSLYRLVSTAGIPEVDTREEDADIDSYNTAIINRFLWGGFLPKTKWTDYQEFLWMKINRLTAEDPTEDYIKFARALYSMSSEQINTLYNVNVDRYHTVASCTPDTLENLKKDMIFQLEHIVKTPKYIRLWKDIYADFFEPNTNIQASDLSALVMELSPFYKDYVDNIVNLCEQVYQYLTSEKGRELYHSIIAAFGDSININNSNHGQLEAIISLPTLYTIKEWRKKK